MKLSINISLDNAALLIEDNDGTFLDTDAVFKAVKKAINALDDSPNINDLDGFRTNIRDANGNTVGRLSITN